VDSGFLRLARRVRDAEEAVGRYLSGGAISVGSGVRLADRNAADTMYLEGLQNPDSGYINFSRYSGNALGAVSGGSLTWRGSRVWDAAALPYETGTWTPEIAGGTTAGVISYTAQNGFYCKTGRLVFVNAHIVINTISAAPTGTLFVRALPFTMTSSTGYRGLAAVYTNLAGWGLGRTQINGYFNPSDGPARLALMGSQNAGSYYYLTGTDIHAGDRIVVTGFYITD